MINPSSHVRLRLISRTHATIALIGFLAILVLLIVDTNSLPDRDASEGTIDSLDTYHLVTHVIDGDTIRVLVAGIEETVRLIGIDTPETAHPELPPECYGDEATAFTSTLLSGSRVSLVADPTQDDRDSYGRLLRYVFREDGTHVNLRLVEEGFAREYTYRTPYHYQDDFRTAERTARNGARGLWGASCDRTLAEGFPPHDDTGSSCSIKGNVSTSGTRLYHTPVCEAYEKTVINPARGERWFCTEEEARSAGWEKAANCP